MRILAPLVSLALVASGVPAFAQQAAPPKLTLEQQMRLRCSAVFGIVAGQQARGEATAGAYPPMAERGREFFVRSSAQLMDELDLSREEVEVMILQVARTIQSRSTEAGFIDGLMKPCLSALDASGL